jgi:hypothetical protein
VLKSLAILCQFVQSTPSAPLKGGARGGLQGSENSESGRYSVYSIKPEIDETQFVSVVRMQRNGRSSPLFAIETQSSKLLVAGSIPISRSMFQ